MSRGRDEPVAGRISRREFLGRLGGVAAGVVLGQTLLAGSGASRALAPTNAHAPAPDPARSTRGYLEFSDRAGEVERVAAGFDTRDWRVRIGGLVEREHDLALEELLRCMPASRPFGTGGDPAAAAPLRWTGFPLAALVRWARPLPAARFLRVVSFVRPYAAPNQARATCYPWPYGEALPLVEALDERAFVATGLGGHPLPPHRGAPLRLVLPWKRGCKSVKAIARFEFTERQPQTFWGQLRPREYEFAAERDARG